MFPWPFSLSPAIPCGLLHVLLGRARGSTCCGRWWASRLLASQPAAACQTPCWPLPFAFPSVEMLIESVSFIQLFLFIKLVEFRIFDASLPLKSGSKSHFGWGKELEEKTNDRVSLVSWGSQTKDVYLRLVSHIIDQAGCILWCTGIVGSLITGVIENLKLCL